jgi:hypothetical protein
MSTIITRNSANSGSTPASLVQGELAINVTDGRLFYGSGSGNVVKEFTGSASGGTTIDTGSFVTTSSFNAYTGSNTSQFAGTASYATNALTASYAEYAVSASYEINYETSSSYADFAVSASHALNADNAISASHALNSISSSYSLTSTSASYALTSTSASYAATASYVQTAQTASYVLNAVSASYAPGGNPFPYTGSAEITGSLGVTGSFSLQTFNGLTDVTALDFGGVTRVINDVMGSTSINADDREAYDSAEEPVPAINWEIRRLIDSSGVVAMRWDQRLTYDTVDSQSIDWNIRQLKFDNDASDYTVDWNEGILQDTAAKFSVDWQNRQLKDSSGNENLNWSSGIKITGSALVSGSLTVTGSLTVSGSSTFTNIGPAQFSGSFGIQGAGDGYDGPYTAITIDDANYTRTLHDSLTGTPSLDFGNRSLVDGEGNFVLSWDGTEGYINSTLYSNNKVGDTTRNTLLSNFASAGQTLDEVIFDSTVADFDLVYLETDGTWYPVEQSTASSTKLLGICLGYDPETGLGTVILEGDVSVSTSAGSAPVVDNANYGLPVYIAYNAGNTMDTTIPVNGYVRVLGHCYYSDGGSNWIMKFRPSNDWIEI